MEWMALAQVPRAQPLCFRRWPTICSTKNLIRLFLASAFPIVLGPDLTFRPMELLKSCSISRHTTIMSSCATAVLSFGSHLTTLDGPIIWCKKLASPPDAPPEVRHPRRHLRRTIRLITQQDQAHLAGLRPRPPFLPPRALAALALPKHPQPSPPRVPSVRAAALLCRRTSFPRAAGRPRTSTARSARTGIIRGGRAILICATAVATRPPLFPLFKIPLRRRSTRPQHPTQTARHTPITALLLTPAPTDCVAASGVTVDQQRDIVEIAVRVEIAGPRKKMEKN